jgi:hypothetical protein
MEKLAIRFLNRFAVRGELRFLPIIDPTARHQKIAWFPKPDDPIFTVYHHLGTAAEPGLGWVVGLVGVLFGGLDDSVAPP